MRPTLFAIALLALTSSFAQTRSMTDLMKGKVVASENSYNSAFPMLQQAHNQFQLTNWEEALLTLDNAVITEPNSAEALMLRAKVKRSMGMFAEAQKDFTHALRLNPYVADVYGYSGQAGLMSVLSSYPRASMDQLQEAERVKYYYYDIDRKLENELLTEASAEKLEEVLVALENGQESQARNLLTEFISDKPDNAIALDLQGIFYLRDSLTKLAERSFRKAVYILPDFAIGWYNLGRTYVQMGDPETAKSYFSKAIKLRPDLTKAYFERAAILKSMGENQLAIDDYNEVISQNGYKYEQAYLNRGLTKKMQGDFSGALTDLNLIIDDYPQDPYLYKNRGNLQLLFGSVRQGISDYTDAIRYKPDFAEAYFNRGIAHFITYDRVSGCSDMEKSTSLGYPRAEEFIRYFCAIR